MKNCVKNSFLFKSLCVSLLLVTVNITATPGVSDAQAHGVSLQSDGKIVAAGYVTLDEVSQIMLARYTSSGAVDGTYGNNGYVATPINTGAGADGLVLLSSDYSVIAGFGEPPAGTGFALARYDTDGVLDPAFNSTGIVNTLIGDGSSAHSLVLQADGKYVTTGVAIISGNPNTALTRTNDDGSLDSGFGSAGIVTTQIEDRSIGYAIALQSDNQIVVVGDSSSSGVPHFAVARYNSTDGSLDTSFNSGGSQPGTVSTSVGSNASARALAIQSNGKIVAGGTADSGFALVRYNTDGSLDTTGFGTGGIKKVSVGTFAQINAIALQADGKIVAVGYSDDNLVIARFNTNGTLDTGFNTSGIVSVSIGSSAQASALVIQGDGKIVVAGTSDSGAIVTRYNSDGTLDNMFGTNGVIKFPNSSQAPDVFGITNINIADDAGISYSKLNLINSIINSDISSSAAIADTKLATITTAGKVANSATTATASNTASAIVTRDSLGNFIANAITSDLTGNVTGSASNNVLKAGDTLTGSLMHIAGSAANPAIQFTGSTNTGLSAATANNLVLSTNGSGRMTINNNGAVTINNPTSGVGLTVSGGGAAITGDLAVSGGLSYNTSGTSLNSVGSTQGPLVKIYTGSGNTGVSGSVSINYSAAGFSSAPTIYALSVGSVAVLGVSSITSTSATIGSGVALNTAFNYLAVGI